MRLPGPPPEAKYSHEVRKAFPRNHGGVVMQQVELEGPKLKVSAVGFGCAGLMQSPSRKERMAVLGSAVDSGITHCDIARMYGLGRAETELGAFLRTVDRGSV